jgi:dipeptidyl aminopeptidase/acylaminoacyl peptidase
MRFAALASVALVTVSMPAALNAAAASAIALPAHCVFQQKHGLFEGSCGPLFGQMPTMTLQQTATVRSGIWRKDIHPISVWAGVLRAEGDPDFPLELEIYSPDWGVLRTEFGWYPVSHFRAGATLTFELDPSHAVTANELDRKIIERAATILATDSVWNRSDNRQCPADASTWSIYCAMQRATIEMTGGFNHRRPALEIVRQVVEERTEGRNYQHRLMNYNNDSTTQLEDVRSLFAEALVRSRSPVAAAAQAPDAPQTRLTPERAVKFRRPSDLHFSPDGSAVVCVVSQVDGLNIDSHLWLLHVAQQDLHQLTFSGKSERSPQWAPSGNELAFLSNRAGATQIYVMPRDGGEARPVTASVTGVTRYQWSPDGKQIAYLARAPESEQDVNVPRVADREQNLERLWVVDLESRKNRQVTSGAWRIDDFNWTKSDQFLAIATDNPRVETWNNALFSIALGNGAFTPFGKPNQPFNGLLVSPGRKQVAFVSTRSAGPIPHDLYVQSSAGGPAQDVTAAVDRAVLGARWQNDSTIFVRVADGFRNKIFRVGLREPATRIDLPYAVRDFDVSSDGNIIFAGVGFDRLPELFTRRVDGTITQAGRLQEGWEGIRLTDAELFHFKSFDGTDIEAALMEPRARHGGKLPLVLLVHGGPASNFSADYFWFNSWPQLLVDRGYEVLMVNPRGSVGYGERFVKANRADLGGGDFKDIMAALDNVIARGKTDANRLGIGGWSYGGEMTQWAIGHSTRFKAAVSGGGVFDEAAEFGTEDGPAEDLWYFGSPWEHPEVYARNSPANYLRNVKTPTLIVHGEEDHNNPVGQSLALYRALKYFGVESELVTYPGEPHLPRQERHQIDILQRMLDWYDRHLN